MTIPRNKLLVAAAFVMLALALVLALALGFRPHQRHAGTPLGARVPLGATAERHASSQIEKPGGERAEILFGDLHVHTTFSTDAFAWSLPLVQGEGAHPAADACDFARFCSNLDFFAITDHAESLTPRRWEEEKASIRACNAAAGDPRDPDVVAYTGFEWTQVGNSRDNHYGHRNIVFRDDADDKLPTRPIATGGIIGAALRGPGLSGEQLGVLARDLQHKDEYLDWALFQRETSAVPPCAAGVDVHALPTSCRETADTPRVLFEKLAQWGFPSLAIPHGTTWGFYTPLGTNWKKQLTPAMLDDDHQRLFEIYSGHGNGEEYRRWKEVEVASDGSERCPAPTADYEPCCHRAGMIIRSRCGPDVDAKTCDARVAEAERLYLKAGVSGHHTVPGATAEDWKDCGQCRDCFQPAFSYRPGNSAEAILAHTDFSTGAPVRQTFGFIASSDNHKARPGTGYKAYARRAMTEANGPVDDEALAVIIGRPEAPTPTARAIDPLTAVFKNGFQRLEGERGASFFTTGGLVAVHAEGRSREAIWEALRARRVYGTSGDRMLLWFSVENVPGAAGFMGSEVQLGETPRFVVRALGGYQQKPGCPDWSRAALGDAGIERLCRGECYHPGDARRRITRVEVVRVRPQVHDGEPIDDLIEDPWKRLVCDAGSTAEGCTVRFEDPDFTVGGRDATYYVRAIEEPTPEVNGSNLRCTRDAAGQCLDSHPCYADFRTPMSDDCLAPVEERAWSSPIYVRWKPGSAGAP